MGRGGRRGGKATRKGGDFRYWTTLNTRACDSTGIATLKANTHIFSLPFVWAMVRAAVLGLGVREEKRVFS